MVNVCNGLDNALPTFPLLIQGFFYFQPNHSKFVRQFINKGIIMGKPEAYKRVEEKFELYIHLLDQMTDGFKWDGERSETN